MDHAAPSPATSSPVPQQKGAWVVYDESRDDRQRFVARKFFIGPNMLLDADDAVGAASLVEVRKLLPEGLTNLGRTYDDPANVVETWA